MTIDLIDKHERKMFTKDTQFILESLLDLGEDCYNRFKSMYYALPNCQAYGSEKYKDCHVEKLNCCYEMIQTYKKRMDKQSENPRYKRQVI